MMKIRRVNGGNDHILYRKLFANHEGVQTRKVQGYICNAGIEVWSWLQLVYRYLESASQMVKNPLLMS